MKRLSVACLAAACIMLAARPASAWGFEAHKYILGRAIALLPPEIRPFFEKYRVTVVEHAIDPDLWRTVGWEAESTRHFLDLDEYGSYPFKELPRDFDEAVKRYGSDMVTKNGLLPWRAQEIQTKLVEAFTQKSPYARENIKLFSSVIGHYLSDAQVPFHATRNHDGQLTGQWGIHSRFESELFDRYKDKLQVTPGPLVNVTSARDFVFDSLLSGFTQVQPVLDADKAAVQGLDFYDDRYFSAFFGKVEPILEARLAAAITATASMISSAWVQAGRLPLPVDEPLTPKKVRRQ
jgi:hypothetical protein